MTVQYRWNPNVEAVEMDGNWVILHADHNTITKLNSTGGLVWSMVQERLDIDSIVQALIEQFDGDPSQVRQDVVSFLSELRRVDVVVTE